MNSGNTGVLKSVRGSASQRAIAAVGAARRKVNNDLLRPNRPNNPKH